MVFDLGVNPLIDEMRHAGASVVELSIARVYTPNAMIQAWRFLRLIKNKRIDIVQTFHQKADTYGAIIAWLAGVKHIISSRRDTGDYKKSHYVFISRLIESWFEKIIVVSDRVEDALLKKEGVDRNRIIKIYNGVDSEIFRPPEPQEAASARQSLGLAPSDFVVGMVANFRPEKNHEALFAGALKAKPSIPELKLLLIGGGPLFEHYSARYGHPASGDLDAIFTGSVHDVQRYLYAMDVACLIPKANEGFSNAVLEKMATGLPLIVSDIGGNAEAVTDGQNGFVIPPNDIGALRQALVSLHADPFERSNMGRESRRRVEQEFSLELMWRSHEKLYHSLCDDC